MVTKREISCPKCTASGALAHSLFHHPARRERLPLASEDAQLRDFYLGIARRRGPKVARVAVARRLLTIVFYALRNEGACRAYPASVASTRVKARSFAVMASASGRR